MDSIRPSSPTDCLPNHTTVLISAVYHLSHLNEHNASLFVFACDLEFDNVQVSKYFVSATEKFPRKVTGNLVLRGRPRGLCGQDFQVAWEALQRETPIKQPIAGPKHGMLDQAEVRRIVHVIKTALYNALPPDFMCLGITFRPAPTIDVDKRMGEFTKDSIDTVQGKDVHNQAIDAQKIITWKHQRFRSVASNLKCNG